MKMPPDYIYDGFAKLFGTYLTATAAAIENEKKDNKYYIRLLGDDDNSVNPRLFIRCILFGADLDDYAETFAEQDRILEAVSKVWWDALEENGITISFKNTPEHLIMIIAHEIGIDSMVKAVLKGVPPEDVLS